MKEWRTASVIRVAGKIPQIFFRSPQRAEYAACRFGTTPRTADDEYRTVGNFISARCKFCYRNIECSKGVGLLVFAAGTYIEQGETSVRIALEQYHALLGSEFAVFRNIGRHERRSEGQQQKKGKKEVPSELGKSEKAVHRLS